MKCPHCGKEIMALGNICKYCGKQVESLVDSAEQKGSPRSREGIKKAIASTLSAFVALMLAAIGYTQYAVEVDIFTKSLSQVAAASKEKMAKIAYGFSFLALCFAIEAIIIGIIMVRQFIIAEKTAYKKSVFIPIFGGIGVLVGGMAIVFCLLTLFTVDPAYLSR